MKKVKKTSFYLLMFLLLISCGQRKGQEVQTTEEVTTVEKITPNIKPYSKANAIYYWKTIYDLNDAELTFLKEHDVKRIYIRYFDVALDNNWLGEPLSVIPVATTVFRQIPPETMEVVPTIYITIEAMREMKGDEADYADRIVTRILAMTKRHNIPNVNEVQFDCDWTKSIQESFFELCRIAGDSLHSKGIALSSTIRLFQLSYSIPPVDRGVLMLYNTGILKESKTENSILNYSDIEPYLKNAKYNLQLDLHIQLLLGEYGLEMENLKPLFIKQIFRTKLFIKSKKTEHIKF